ncbi:HAD family hydrolase [Candidatus Gottesmanbacteria bacterium]|nr:HAD family hydrolase [Candidatus Gottesmanbacteria bacterium]
MQKISGVSVCIWDFDGTLYRPTPALTQAIIEADYELIMRHTGWDKAKTVEEFHKIYKVKTPSSTETAAELAGISVQEAAIECELYKDRRPFLSRDQRLIDMFAKLTHYTHYFLVNGIQEKVRESLDVLGVSPDIFREFVTAEVVGVNKPQPDGFRYIMEKTGFPADAHLMIGDRVAVDLVPAKALGMKTCLVWSEVTDSIADVVLPEVYGVVSVLG